MSKKTSKRVLYVDPSDDDDDLVAWTPEGLERDAEEWDDDEYKYDIYERVGMVKITVSHDANVVIKEERVEK